MATRSSSCYGSGLPHFHSRYFLPQRFAVSSAKKSNLTLEEPKTQNKGQEQDRRKATVFRFQHTEEQNSEDPLGVHRNFGVRDQHADILSGNDEK